MTSTPAPPADPAPAPASTPAVAETLDRSGSLIDHLNLAVPDLTAAVAFYEPVLASIGIAKMLQITPEMRPDVPAMTGFGWPGVKPFFWLVDGGTVGTNMHVAFTVDSRAEVDAFHDEATRQGATVLEGPAVHPEYHDDYYGGFVLDPHGINIEAVCHRPAG